MTRMGDQEIGVISERFPDNPGELLAQSYAKKCSDGFQGQSQYLMWVKFVVGSLLCPETFFSRFSSFPVSTNTNFRKFKFDQE